MRVTDHRPVTPTDRPVPEPADRRPYRHWFGERTPLVNDPLSRKGLDTAEARKWREALAQSVRSDRAKAGECQSALLQDHIQELVRGLEVDLDDLAMLLGP